VTGSSIKDTVRKTREQERRRKTQEEFYSILVAELDENSENGF